MTMRGTVAFLLLVATAPAYARDFYMAPEGSDSNDGTIDKPFLTITKAQAAVQAGDTVLMRGGKYNVTAAQIVNRNAGNSVHVFEIAKSGTEKAPINYFSYKDEKAVFDFAAVKPGPRLCVLRDRLVDSLQGL